MAAEEQAKTKIDWADEMVEEEEKKEKKSDLFDELLILNKLKGNQYKDLIPNAVQDALLDRIKEAIESVNEDVEKAGVDYKPIDAAGIVKAIRKQIGDKMPAETWVAAAAESDRKWPQPIESKTSTSKTSTPQVDSKIPHFVMKFAEAVADAFKNEGEGQILLADGDTPKGFKIQIVAYDGKRPTIKFFKPLMNALNIMGIFLALSVSEDGMVKMNLSHLHNPAAAAAEE